MTSKFFVKCELDYKMIITQYNHPATEGAPVYQVLLPKTYVYT